MLKVGFRVDSSNRIGSGHVTRCLTLAKALRNFGAKCIFACQKLEGNHISPILNAGFRVEVIQGDNFYLSSSDPFAVDDEVDAAQTLNVFSTELDWLIVDHYGIASNWERKVRGCAKKILVIDDLANRQHDCDVLLDQNHVDELDKRYVPFLTQSCLCLLGTRYALLQPEYAQLRRIAHVRRVPIKRIMVSFGAADEHNLTGRTILACSLPSFDDLFFDVVVDPRSKNAEKIRQQVTDRPNITVHNSLPTLAHLMLKADLAIGGGGATSWERCCLGLPTLVISIAENQKPISKELDKNGAAVWLGNFDEVSVEEIAEAISQAIMCTGLEDWSKRCAALVDGEGANRVASVLTLGPDSKLRVRLATLEDEALLLKWANDPMVRANGFSSRQIQDAEHREWFRRRIHDPESYIILIVETIHGVEIGQVRFERKLGEWEINYSLAAFARGKGLGIVLLELAINKFHKIHPQTKLKARVKMSNAASQNVFKKLGFLRRVLDTEVNYVLDLE